MDYIERFILEVKKDSSLLEKYKKGIWYPNYDELMDYRHKKIRNNKDFAKSIKHYHLIYSTDKILETVLKSDEDYTVSEHLNNKRELIESSYGTISINYDPTIYVDSNTLYITNGVYNETEMLIKRLGNFGSFIVGVCDNKDSTFYQENIEKINSLKYVLKKRKVKYRIIEGTQNRDSVYMLYHRSK